MAGDDGLTLRLDTSDWQTLSRDLRTFAPELLLELRRELRSAGEIGVRAVRETLAQPSPDGGPDDGRYRQALAAAAKVSLSFSARSAGVSISTNNKQIPEAHQAIMRAYNKDSFRHPVFDNPAQWVEQRGRPYFGEVFEQMVINTALEHVNRALGNAMTALERHRNP